MGARGVRFKSIYSYVITNSEYRQEADTESAGGKEWITHPEFVGTVVGSPDLQQETVDDRDGSGFSDTEIIDSLASNQEEQDDEQEKTTPEADGEV